MEMLKVSALFAITALLEIVGCYLPWLVLRQDKPVWLLTACRAGARCVRLAPDPAPGRRRAHLRAYGGMYIVVALAWLYLVDGVALTRWDRVGAAVALAGMAIIALQPEARA
jgi:small multidrug resistance family-3 protein